jgi:hypothetical protein
MSAVPHSQLALNILRGELKLCLLFGASSLRLLDDFCVVEGNSLLSNRCIGLKLDGKAAFAIEKKRRRGISYVSYSTYEKFSQRHAYD